MDKKYTIKDIGKLAGVSKGTVDRVLHQRGKVSSKAMAQVQKVLKEIDYQPNPIARNLKNNKVYNICVLLPDPEVDQYWEPAVQGIKKAIKEFKPFGLRVHRYYFDPREKTSFTTKAQELVSTAPDALLMAPLFQKEALAVLKECKSKDIQVALFNNVIDVFNRENFIGQDLYQSGKVAANLIDKLIGENNLAAIVHINEEANMKQRENGFKAYFEDKNKLFKIKSFSLKTADTRVFKKEANEILKKHSKISAIFVTNSKAYQFINAVGSSCKDITIVGYDLLDENISFLKSGCIDFLIHQKPKRQAYLGLENLAEHFLFGKPIPNENLLPIDIITTENYQYYIERGI